MVLKIIAGCCLLAAPLAIAKNQEPDLDSSRYESVIEWMTAVQKESTGGATKVLYRFVRGVNAVASAGTSEMMLRELPSDYLRFDEKRIQILRLDPLAWTKGEYGSLTPKIEGIVFVKALNDHCVGHNGVLYGVRTASGQHWFCEIDNRVQYAAWAEQASRSADGRKLAAVVVPRTSADAEHFHEMSVKFRYKGNASPQIGTYEIEKVISNYRPNATYVNELVGQLCPKLVDEMVRSGHASHGSARGGEIAGGNTSFIAADYTLCKAFFTYKLDIPDRHPDFVELRTKDARERSSAIHSFFSKQCDAADGTLQQANYKSVGGRVAAHYFCIRANEQAAFGFRDHVDDSDEVHFVSVIEPKSDASIQSQGYVDELRRYGYRTASEREEEKRIAGRKFWDDAAAQGEDEIRRMQERPLKMQVGTRLCQDVDEYRRIAFVEQKSPDNDKIQLRIVDMHARNNPGVRPGGFQAGSVIWDHADNWLLCE